jgi:ABC-2 type transport system permease protein
MAGFRQNWPLALYGSMMLSQAMEAITRAFYGRGDLGLILSSPVTAWRLFAVRIGAIAVTIAVMSLALAAPFINILAWFGGLRWLAPYGVIVALAMLTVAVAVMFTVGLFRAIGPKHTRLCAQIVAAVIGASFVIGVQLAAILSCGTPSRVVFCNPKRWPNMPRTVKAPSGCRRAPSSAICLR